MYKNFLYKCPIEKVNITNDIQNEFIDMVYTWVDSSDTEWRKKKNIYKPSFIEEIRYPDENNPDTELQMSLLFSLKNVKWIRHIYIVTMRPQIPNCLYSNFYLKTLFYSGKIKIIHHDQIGIPLTFNSNVIECYLHNIPLLSENFIYMNDDFFILKEVPYSYFFYKNKPLIILRTRVLCNFTPKFMLNMYLQCVVHTFSTLMENNSYCMKHHSMPYTLNKNFCKKIYEKYFKFIKENDKNLFRSPKDFIFYLVVYNEGMYQKEYFTFENPPFQYKFVNATNLPDNIGDYTFLCMNNISNENLMEQINILKSLL